MASNMVRRVTFAVVAIPVLVGVVWLGEWALALLLAVAAVLGIGELFELAAVGGVRPLGGLGRVIAALAGDPDVMARSGGTFISAEVAQHYGITDIDGRVIPSLRADRGSPIWGPIAEAAAHGR